MPILGGMTYLDESTASIGWNPDATDRILLAGDETALPVMQTILATLPAKSRGQVFGVCWLVRDRGQVLRRSVDAWLSEMLPTSAFDDHRVYAWIANDGAARTLSSN
jgi:NADPH-dependent ferric siderophore reductase